MKRPIAWLIWLITVACATGVILTMLLFMIMKIQDVIASGRSMQTVFELILVFARMVVFLGIPVLMLWGINTFDRRIAWLYISASVGLLVWVIYDGIRDAVAEGRLMQMLLMWALVLVGGLVMAIVILGGFAGIDILRERIRKRQYRLPEGVTMEMVLRESPYELRPGAVDLGEPEYYIVDKRTGEFVDWEDPEGAEGWIIRQYLKKRRNEQQDRTLG